MPETYSTAQNSQRPVSTKIVSYVTIFPLGSINSPVGSLYSISDLKAGPDGNLWFTAGGANGSVVGRITPSGVISNLTQVGNSTTSLGSLAFDKAGNLWVAATTFQDSNTVLSELARISPSGSISHFPLPINPGNPFFPYQANRLTTGPDGNIWYTEFSWEGSGYGSIVKVTPTGRFTRLRIFAPKSKAPSSNQWPWDITVGPGNNLYFSIVDRDSDVGPSEKKGLGVITPGGKVRFITFPKVLDSQGNDTGIGGASALTKGPDGSLWFIDSQSSPEVVRIGVWRRQKK